MSRQGRRSDSCSVSFTKVSGGTNGPRPVQYFQPNFIIGVAGCDT